MRITHASLSLRDNLLEQTRRAFRSVYGGPSPGGGWPDRLACGRTESREPEVPSREQRWSGNETDADIHT